MARKPRQGQFPGTEGRPKAEISKDDFEKHCAIQCTKREIAGWFKVDEKTIDAWCFRTYRVTFSIAHDDFRQAGFISVRRKQFQKAMDGSDRMLTWWGKQYLGQRDKVDVDNKNTGSLNIDVHGLIMDEIDARNKKGNS